MLQRCNIPSLHVKGERKKVEKAMTNTLVQSLSLSFSFSHTLSHITAFKQEGGEHSCFSFVLFSLFVRHVPCIGFDLVSMVCPTAFASQN